jgi:hypothetical protein
VDGGGVDYEHDETISFIGTVLKLTSVNFVDVTTKTRGTKQ